MAISDSQAQLTQAAKDLALHWQQTREVWRDAVAEQVEKETIEPLLLAVRSASDAMARLQEAVAKAERDCADEMR